MTGPYMDINVELIDDVGQPILVLHGSNADIDYHSLVREAISESGSASKDANFASALARLLMILTDDKKISQGNPLGFVFACEVGVGHRDLLISINVVRGSIAFSDPHTGKSITPPNELPAQCVHGIIKASPDAIVV